MSKFKFYVLFRTGLDADAFINYVNEHDMKAQHTNHDFNSGTIRVYVELKDSDLEILKIYMDKFHSCGYSGLN